MDDSNETMLVDERKRGGAVVPWLLFLAAVGGGGYLYWTVHRPMAEDAHKKDAELARLAEASKRDADAAKAAQAELDKAQEELKQVREDLARTAAQKTDDDKLLEQLKKEVGASGGAEVQGVGGQITVTMVDRILFKSGEAALTPQGEQVLRKLGGVLAGADKLIEVSGHADNQPVESQRKQQFPTNWELSTGRATNVVRFLQEKVGLKPRRLKASGFGPYRPIASNATPAGRARNRRIEILLLPNRMRVVKGDFADEIAAAEKPAPPAGRAKAAAAKAPAKQRAK